MRTAWLAQKVSVFICIESTIMAYESSTLKFVKSLRGSRVYRSTWKPFMKQEITFKQEKDNKHDRFAVVGQTILPGTLFPTTLGHILIELSRYAYVWFSLKRGANIMRQVKSIKYKLMVSTGSRRLRNTRHVEVAVHNLGGRTGIGNFKEENRRSELSSRGDRGVSRSIKRHFELDFKRRSPVR